jgi:type IV fimbrial biogenesis protein FimT
MIQSHSIQKSLPSQVRGFTLIELMVTIALLAILTTLAAPSFAKLIASTRLSSATNELYTSLVQAKSDAIRLGSRVTVCPSSNGSSCITSGTPTWTTGWITFSDTTRAATPSVDAGEKILQIGQALDASISIRGSLGYASFASDGSAKLINGGLYTAKIRVCSPSASLNDNERARDISILRSGRVEITKPTTGVSAACPVPSST